MIRPIIATKNPYVAAEEFEKCGWNIDFQTPQDGDDPLAGVSLYGNEILLGTMEEKYVSIDAAPFVGAGIEIHILIHEENIQAVYNKHLCLSPSKLEMQFWGELGFRVQLQGYWFMIIAKREKDN